MKITLEKIHNARRILAEADAKPKDIWISMPALIPGLEYTISYDGITYIKTERLT